MARSRNRALALTGLGAGCAGAFAWLSAMVLQGRANGMDRRIHEWLEERANPALDSAMDLVGALSAPAFLVTATLFIAFALRRRGRAVSLPIVFSPLVAMTTGSLMTALMPPRYPPDAARCGYEPCFPSGHTTGATSELLVSSYVLMREQILPPSLATGVLAIPLLAGCARVYRGRHWYTDVAAGWLMGITIATLCAATYESGKKRFGPAVSKT